MNNILVVSVNWLGDVIFSTPVYYALKEAYPQATISVLAVPRVHDVIRCIGPVDETITYEEKGKHRSWREKWGLARRLRSREFDAAFLLRPSVSRALILKLAGIPVRVGYAKKGSCWLLTHPLEEPQEDVHRSDYYAHVVESFGVDVKKRQTQLQLDAESRQNIDALLSRKGLNPQESFIVVNPGGNWHLKRWPQQRFIGLIRQLIETRSERIVLTGAPKDRELSEQIEKEVASKHLVNLVGKTDLRGLAALLEKAAVVISADSGPLHIANSVGTKVVGIYGPTRPEVTGPRGIQRSRILQKDIGCNLKPCYFLDCPNNQCMQAVTIEETVDAVKRLAQK